MQVRITKTSHTKGLKMNFDISSFNRIAKPLLNTLAEQFPLPLKIHLQRYEAPDFDVKMDIPLLRATLYYLAANNYLMFEGDHADNANYYLTSKGLELLKVDFEKEFKKSSSVYDQGKVGC